MDNFIGNDIIYFIICKLLYLQYKQPSKVGKYNIFIIFNFINNSYYYFYFRKMQTKM